ncbi:hypothetical protein BS78_01G048000 [Paspalum vaginatum]|nr:hypothetical protein BS78_01G048000 [Paspalum vaginatum]KAJ1293179.1 hypothetical protein BS78_01G048000 [Paspalum vaginatum]
MHPQFFFLPHTATPHRFGLRLCSFFLSLIQSFGCGWVSIVFLSTTPSNLDPSVSLSHRGQRKHYHHRRILAHPLLQLQCLLFQTIQRIQMLVQTFYCGFFSDHGVRTRTYTTCTKDTQLPIQLHTFCNNGCRRPISDVVLPFLDHCKLQQKTKTSQP